MRVTPAQGYVAHTRACEDDALWPIKTSPFITGRHMGGGNRGRGRNVGAAICRAPRWTVTGCLLLKGEGKQTVNPGIRSYKNGSVCYASEAPFCERRVACFCCCCCCFLS